MSEEPGHMITKVTAMHGISAKGDTLLIGVQVNHQPFGWGECEGLFRDPSIVYNMGTAAGTIHKVVAPALQERPFTNIRDLFQRLESLTEPITRLELVETPKVSSGISRRSVLSGTFTEEATIVSEMHEVTAKRPLSPSMLFGICQAILNGTAHARQQSPTQLLAADYELSPPPKNIGLHVEVTDENMVTVNSILKEHVKSLGYTIKSSKPKAALGEKGERLEKLVAELSTWISTKKTNPHVAIHLDVNGTMTELFGSHVGRILYLLNALEQAGAPYQVRLENLGAERGQKSPTKVYRQLKSFLVHQEKPVQLVAGFPHHSLATLQEFIDRGKIHGVHLNIAHIGNIDRAIALIAACREKEMQVMVSGGSTVSGVETAVYVAAATGADLVAGPPDVVYNTLQRSQFT